MTNPDATDAVALIAILDETAAAAYRAMRALGLSVDAAKDAITVHVSDTLVPLANAEHDHRADDHDEGSGGVHVGRFP